MRSYKKAIGITGAILMAGLALATVTRAQDTGMFPFVIPWNDASPTITDVSFLNDGPAGSHGFIVAKGGHFVESKTGRRIRFLGVDFTFHANFPTHADADQVAARLAKYGVNLIRFHHMDNGNGQAGSIIDAAAGNHRHLNPVQLDRLDYLISQLEKHGIYANLNLHVSRQFTAADGFPASVSQIKTSFDKRVDYFDPRMIALQKEYARELLTHVNPYTHRAYTDDPGVLNVEITNEDSLVGDPWAQKGNGLADLPQPFEGELQTLWNRWLSRKYPNTPALRTAWEKSATPPGPSILKPTANPANWSLETRTGTAAALSTDGDALKISVTKVDGTNWHVQIHQTGLTLKDGAVYTVSFRAKADPPLPIGIDTAIDEADWHNTGLSQSATPGANWKSYWFSFTARDAIAGHCRLSFALGAQPGTIWLSDVKLQPGITGAALASGVSLKAASIPVPTQYTPAEQVDWMSFLADTERSFADGMRNYLKNDLHLHSMVICSQISYGGLAGLYRERDMDFADNHAYWEHPSFPHKPWDPVDWNIRNTSMIPHMGKGDELTRLASQRVAGKPYTISEYNCPAPNDYQAECVPLYASFAAAQDWDAIYLFDYGDYGAGAPNDRIQGFFGVGSNPAKFAFFPTAALIFRGGEIPTAGAANMVALPTSVSKLVAPATVTKADAALSALREQAGSHRLSVEARPGVVPVVSGPATPVVTWQTAAPDRALYTAVGPSALVVAGFVAGASETAGGATFQFGESPDHFAVLTLAATDQKPLAQSQKMILTVADRVENTGMQWNATRTSVENHWGTAPSIADPVDVTVTLPVDGPRRVFALDGKGAQTRAIPATFQNGRLRFETGRNYHTLWYAIVR